MLNKKNSNLTDNLNTLNEFDDKLKVFNIDNLRFLTSMYDKFVIKHFNSVKEFPCNILYEEEDVIEIVLYQLDEAFEIPMEKGHSLLIIASNLINKDIAILNGIILNFSYANKKIKIIVKILKIKTAIDIRQTQRFPVNLIGKIKSDKISACIITDMSINGLKILTNKQFNILDTINFSVELDKIREISFTAIIRRSSQKNKSYIYGLEICKINPKDKNILQNYLESLITI